MSALPVSARPSPVTARPPKKVAAIQSSYIPWKGYFDIMHDVDLFVFYDDVPYSRLTWRNRNLLKTPAGPKWLTIPVGSARNRLICDVEIQPPSWAVDHWKRIRQHYHRAPYFETYRERFEEIYLGRPWPNLSEFNQHLLVVIARELLGLTTEFCDSRQYQPQGRKLDRLLDMLLRAGAEAYLSGPAARGYIDPARFEAAGIELRWKDYAGYPEYPQFFPPFKHEVSVLDLLFHTGPAAPFYIWGWR